MNTELKEAVSEPVEVSAQNQRSPAPWSVRPSNTPTQTQENYIKRLYVADSDGLTVVNISDCTHVGATPEQHANARLIASSPDLLEACIDAMREAYDDCHSEGDPHDESMQTVKANLFRKLKLAINKAEGKQ